VAKSEKILLAHGQSNLKLFLSVHKLHLSIYFRHFHTAGKLKKQIQYISMFNAHNGTLQIM